MKDLKPFGNLTGWSLSNFKAISSGAVSFPGLTVLLGANSSGKSSVVQSALAMCQVAQGDFGNRFPLTGELTRLGTIAEVSQFGNGSFELEAKFQLGNIRFGIEQDEIGMYHAPEEAQFEADEARIKTVRLEWGKLPSSKFENAFEISLIELEDSSDLFQELALGNLKRKDLPIARYRLSGAYECFGFCADASPSPGHEVPEGLSMRWAPTSSSMQLDASQQAASFSMYEDFVWTNVLSDRFANSGENAELLMSMLTDARTKTTSDIKDYVARLTSFFKASTGEPGGPNLSHLFDFLAGEDDATLWRFSAVIDEYESGVCSPELKAAIDDLVSLPSWMSWADVMPVCWQSWIYKFNVAIESIPDSFRYLGPLRLDPQLLQSHTRANNSCVPVGRNGENATHLIWHSERENPADAYPTPDGRGVFSLTEAISLWLEFLELGSPISFRNLGNAGFETRVGGRPIYNLGTGVSQMFPLLALCLVEQSDRVILIEQPELHLHPSSQQKLADFLVAMIENGRRIVVETHSEYLVTRLRRRVAVDGIDKDKFELVFVEKGGSGSEFKVSKLHETGQFSYWPEGFFGQVEDDLISILEADIRRRVD